MGEERFRIKSGMTNEEIADQARNDERVQDDDKKRQLVGTNCHLVCYVIQELRN